MRKITKLYRILHYVYAAGYATSYTVSSKFEIPRARASVYLHRLRENSYVYHALREPPSHGRGEYAYYITRKGKNKLKYLGLT